MNIRHVLSAGAALIGATLFAGPVLAMEQIHIPDSSAAQSSGPPDALFDKSVPATWQKKTDGQQTNGAGPLHFSFSSGSAYGQTTTQSFGEDAKTPGSEFHLNGVPLQDPYFPTNNR